jgi:hypothetical protein
MIPMRCTCPKVNTIGPHDPMPGCAPPASAPETSERFCGRCGATMLKNHCPACADAGTWQLSPPTTPPVTSPPLATAGELTREELDTEIGLAACAATDSSEDVEESDRLSSPERYKAHVDRILAHDAALRARADAAEAHNKKLRSGERTARLWFRYIEIKAELKAAEAERQRLETLIPRCLGFIESLGPPDTYTRELINDLKTAKFKAAQPPASAKGEKP